MPKSVPKKRLSNRVARKPRREPTTVGKAPSGIAPSLESLPVFVRLQAARAPEGVAEAPRQAQSSEEQLALSTGVPGATRTPRMEIFVLADENGENGEPRLIVASFEGARVIERFAWRETSLPGAGKRWERIIQMHESIKNAYRGDGGNFPLEADLKSFGTDLFDVLIHGGVRRLYDLALNRYHDRRLELVLVSNNARWSEKPWEFAFDQARSAFLATQELYMLRDVFGAVPRDRVLAHPLPLRILFVYAQPVGAGHLSTEEEERLVRSSFSALTKSGDVEIEVLAHATPLELQKRLNSRPVGHFDVMHFVGHGYYDSEQKQGYLLFEDEQQRQNLLSDMGLREILCGRGLRLVFLNACEGAQGGYADFNRGVGPALLAAGVPAVVANQYSVFDSSAVVMATEFYSGLARGLSLCEAMREARISLRYQMTAQSLDWAVPVLFTRVPELALIEGRRFNAAARVDDLMARVAAGDSTARNGILDGKKRRVVAVWDVGRKFPGLDLLLERLNRVQSHFWFKRVEIPRPSEFSRRQGDMMDADRLQKHLKKFLGILNVDLLFAILDQRMRDEKVADLFAYWEAADPRNRASASRVLLASIAGWDVPVRGEEADLLVINLLAGLLAGVEAGLDSHKGGPRDCPLYYNGERDMDLLIHRQKFSAPVHKKLARVSESLKQALDAILEAK